MQQFIFFFCDSVQLLTEKYLFDEMHDEHFLHYVYIDTVMRLFVLADDLYMRNPADVPKEEVDLVDNTVNYIIDRGEYHVNKTLKR
jgi:hypothetical protein